MQENLPPFWREIQKTNITRIEDLLSFLELSEDKKEKILKKPKFPLNLPLRLALKIQKNCLEDPILKQFVPMEEEKETSFGSLEPLQDQDFCISPKLLKKYEKRSLLLTTSACAMHCRYCFRQNFPYETETKGFEREIKKIEEDSTLSEIILSGGDPLSLSNASLEKLFSSFEKIDHLQRIRFHTRFPIGIPERIDDAFLKLLDASSKQIFFVIHCNHPKELDEEVKASLKKIQGLGVPVLNQSVLLKGVNDDEETLFTLCESLINIGVIPYYLHLHDPVLGTRHFDVPDSRGTFLIQSLQKRISGYGVPRLVREIPKEESKSWIQ